MAPPSLAAWSARIRAWVRATSGNAPCRGGYGGVLRQLAGEAPGAAAGIPGVPRSSARPRHTADRRPGDVVTQLRCRAARQGHGVQLVGGGGKGAPVIPRRALAGRTAGGAALPAATAGDGLAPWPRNRPRRRPASLPEHPRLLRPTGPRRRCPRRGRPGARPHRRPRGSPATLPMPTRPRPGRAALPSLVVRDRRRSPPAPTIRARRTPPPGPRGGGPTCTHDHECVAVRRWRSPRPQHIRIGLEQTQPQ